MPPMTPINPQYLADIITALLVGLAGLVTAVAGAAVLLVKARAEIQAAHEDTKAIKAETSPNDGSSIKDSVARIESTMNSVSANLAALRETAGTPLSPAEGESDVGSDPA